MVKLEDIQKFQIINAFELRNWLEHNHHQKESIWLVTFKKNNPNKYVSREEVLDELLCFGWIDGIRRKLDENRTMQLISPRKVQHWAKSYKVRAERLIKENKMHEAGFKSIKESKKSGLWDFMNDVDLLIIPEDLIAGLQKQPEAFKFFNQINDSSKRFALRWLKLAKTGKTRQNRIHKIVFHSKNFEKLPGS